MTGTPTPAAAPEGFMFDLDGTLVLSDAQLGGYRPIEGAAQTLAALEARSIPWVALTNGSAYPARIQARRLREAGLPIPDDRLFTPNSVAALVMAARGAQGVLVLGNQGVIDALSELGIRALAPDQARAQDCDAVYSAWHPDCTMADIHLACEAVLAGAAFFTASDVPFFATRAGRSFGYSCAINGAVARVTGVEPELTGKPSAHALALVGRELGLPAARIGIVGDDPVAEMKMAREGGAIGIAVASGSTSRQEWAGQPQPTSPHLLIDSIAGLLDATGLA